MEHFEWLAGFWFPYINFFLFLLVLVWAIRKPLRDMAEKKRHDFVVLYDNAKEAEKKAREKMQELDLRLAKIDEEVAAMKKKAKSEADAEAKEIVKQGRELAEHLKNEARRLGENETARAKLMLQEELVSEVRKQVVEQLKTGLDESKKASLFQQQVDGLERLSLSKTSLKEGSV